MVFAGVYIMDARTEPGPGPLLNRELKAAEGVRAGLGPPLGGSRVVCRFGLFLIDKIASQKKKGVRATGPASRALVHRPRHHKRRLLKFNIDCGLNFGVARADDISRPATRASFGISLGFGKSSSAIDSAK